jgi:hypothetical protein
VTRTFRSSVAMTIPNSPKGDMQVPASVYPSTIHVSGFTQGRILKVRPSLLGFSHTQPTDVDFLLVAPGNVGVKFVSDAGYIDDVTGITLTFDNDAPGVPPDALVSGVFQPSNFGEADDPMPPPAPAGFTGHSLARFNNRNPNGLWRLYVVDDFPSSDTGSLAGWAVTIQARVRVPHQHRRGGALRPTRRANR